jgi:hypothetical protein
MITYWRNLSRTTQVFIDAFGFALSFITILVVLAIVGGVLTGCSESREYVCAQHETSCV